LRSLALALALALLPVAAAAQTTDEECRIDGMQHAYELWQPNPAEAALIAASGGRALREKNILKVMLDDGRHLSFFDLIPVEGEAVTCGHIEPEIYRFEGATAGKVKLRRNSAKLSVDTASGAIITD
jgi:hypothetical protein